MKKYGVASCKPSLIWSNSWMIKELDLGPLTDSEKANSIPLAHSYRDRNGVKRCTGKKRTLKESQTLVQSWFRIFFKFVLASGCECECSDMHVLFDF